MTPRDRLLLVIDAAVNLLLGGVLLTVPGWLVRTLGAPPFATRFYTSILGGVLVGIGLALLLEARRTDRTPVGLGLGGAIAINMCGAGVLAVWLIATSQPLPVRGRVILWSIAAVVLVIAGAEIWAARTRDRRGGST
jgi:peptidoglycan/LPS O-acetylase OafA/YrhL